MSLSNHLKIRSIQSDINRYAILPFCVFIAPPLVGFFADKLGNYVRVLLLSIVGWVSFSLDVSCIEYKSCTLVVDMICFLQDEILIWYTPHRCAVFHTLLLAVPTMTRWIHNHQFPQEFHKFNFLAIISWHWKSSRHVDYPNTNMTMTHGDVKLK